MTSTIKVNLKTLANKREIKEIKKGAILCTYMNTAVILPHEEHCVCKCHGSESVCEMPSHLSYIIFSSARNASLAR